MNKITDPREKERKAQELVTSIMQLLEEGWHPFNEDANIKFRNEFISITIEEAIEKYNEFLKKNNLRKKSIQTYASKLKYFSQFFPSQKINQITDQGINKFLTQMQSSYHWTAKTYNAAHQILNALFSFLQNAKYIDINPVQTVNRQKSASSNSMLHKVLSDEDFKIVMEYLEQNDAFTELFAKTIYYSCIRPKELRQLKINMFDFVNNIITIPGSISKNKVTDTVKITSNFRELLDRHNVHEALPNNYIFSSGSKIGGTLPVGENTPYNRFMSCLRKLNLDKKGYSLYSIKHKSNIVKYLNGWTVAEIMKANRHGSISQTEEYLRELTKFINIDQKEIPKV